MIAIKDIEATIMATCFDPLNLRELRTLHRHITAMLGTEVDDLRLFGWAIDSSTDKPLKIGPYGSPIRKIGNKYLTIEHEGSTYRAIVIPTALVRFTFKTRR